MLKSEQIQAEIDNKRAAIEQEKLNGQQANHEQINQWENEISVLEMSKSDAKAEEAQQQAHEGRVQEATVESENILDDIYIADVPIAECGLNELELGILKSKVQAKYVAKVELMSIALTQQQAQSQQDLKVVTDRANEAEKLLIDTQSTYKDLEMANYQLTLDNKELDNKVRKGAELLDAANTTIEEQRALIENYKNKELLGEQPKPVLSTSEQVAKQEEELKASRIKVTSMDVTDPNDFSKKMWTITLALTGEKMNINHLEKGKYTLISEAEAEQLRVEDANKKAEIQSIIPSMEVQTIKPLEPPALEQVNTFQENTDTHAEGDTSTTGNQPVEQVVAQTTTETPTVTYATKEEHEALAARVARIEAHANLPAVA